MWFKPVSRHKTKRHLCDNPLFFKKGQHCGNPKYQNHLHVVGHVHVHTYSSFRDVSTISSGFGKNKARPAIAKRTKCTGKYSYAILFIFLICTKIEQLEVSYISTMCCQNFKTNITTQTNLRGLCLFMTMWQITSASWFRNFLEAEIVAQLPNPHYSQDLSDLTFSGFYC